MSGHRCKCDCGRPATAKWRGIDVCEHCAKVDKGRRDMAHQRAIRREKRARFGAKWMENNWESADAAVLHLAGL